MVFILVLQANLVNTAGGLYSGIYFYCNSYHNKVLYFFSCSLLFFFPQVEVLPDCMKDVFDDSVHLLFNHSFLSFPFLHITVLNDLTYSIFFIQTSLKSDTSQ